jgi:dihydrofolate reductase
VVMGKGMYGGWWGDESWEGWWGDDPPFHVPVFVLTHQARGPLTKSDTTYTFVTDGIESAMRQARAAAGDKDVLVSGGGTVVQQALRAGLVDELQVHVAPVLMGDGAPLFGLLRAGQIELEPVRVVDSPKVTHLKYRVVK